MGVFVWLFSVLTVTTCCLCYATRWKERQLIATKIDDTVINCLTLASLNGTGTCYLLSNKLLSNKHLMTQSCIAWKWLTVILVTKALEDDIECGLVWTTNWRHNRSDTTYTTTFLKIVGWLQGSTVCSRVNTALIHILTWGMCSPHHCAGDHYNFAPFHTHTAEDNIQILVIEN